MSITKITEEETIGVWQRELESINKEFEVKLQENIFDFLNRRENLCTPGFLLRRQLQAKFPELVEESAKEADVALYADLISSGNIAWQSKLVECLARSLSRTNFKRYGKSLLHIEWRQWFNYLSDKARCHRDTAVKLIFALDMDELTAVKFLLANGHALLSFRNPFDYVCKVCHACKLTYEDAERLFKMFEEHIKDDNADNTNDNEKFLANDFTRRVKDETETFAKIAENDTISFDDIKEPVLKTMLKYKNEFRDDKNKFRDRDDEGYSKQNLKRFEVLLKYLVLLYPKVWRFVKRDSYVNVDIATNEDGTPKFPKHLIKSMLETQEIDLPEYSELSDYGGPKLSERGKAKRIYDNIPFTRNVLIPLRSLSQTIRAILRAIDCSANAKAVNRDTILFLTYFLITGWHRADDETKEKILANLKTDKEKLEDDALFFAMEEFFDALGSIDDNEEPLMKTYILLLNRMLAPFGFIKFYAPFVLDRFIILCLMSLDSIDEEYLMQLVIDESYRLSNSMMKLKEDSKDDRI